MLIQEKLKKEDFSASQRAVADYILKQGLEIKDMTVRMIAKATYTSSATLIRIAHKLGYTGWEELKHDFLEEQKYLQSHFAHVDANLPFQESDSPTSIVHKIATLEKEAIDDTLSLIDQDELEQVVDVLMDAKTINIMGMNNTVYQAEEFVIKMGRIGYHAFFQSPNGEGAYNGTLYEKDSCLIILSYTGETSKFLQIAQECKQQRVPVIAITSLGDNSLSKLCDYTLRICTREKQYSKISWFTLDVANNFILNVLYSLIFAHDYEKNLRYKIEHAKKIEVNRKASSSIIIEDLDNSFNQDF